MRRTLPLLLAGLCFGLSAGAQEAPRPATAASAQEAAAPSASPQRSIVQQRLPDGRVIFTDRPQPGARTERRWDYTPEDPVAAEARRAAAQREAEAVNARIARQLAEDRERERQLELVRAQEAQAAAEREAARARAEAAQPPPIVTGPIYGYPPWSSRPPPVRPPIHPPQASPRPPGPVIPTRPGFAPLPGPNKPPPAPYEIPYGR